MVTHTHSNIEIQNKRPSKKKLNYKLGHTLLPILIFFLIYKVLLVFLYYDGNSSIRLTIILLKNSRDIGLNEEEVADKSCITKSQRCDRFVFPHSLSF